MGVLKFCISFEKRHCFLFALFRDAWAVNNLVDNISLQSRGQIYLYPI